MRHFLVVTNDIYELIIYDTTSLPDLSRYTGKAESNIRSLISMHSRGHYDKWRGEYKIVIEEE